MTGQVYTTAEVAEQLRCSRKRVREAATKYGLGMNLGGRAGFRFTTQDLDELLEHLRIPAAPKKKRGSRKRNAAA